MLLIQYYLADIYGSLKSANISRNYKYNYVDLLSGYDEFVYAKRPDLTESYIKTNAELYIVL